MNNYYTRDEILGLFERLEIETVADFRKKIPAVYLWYTRHKQQIGDLPLTIAKKPNGFWTKENCAAAARAFQHKSDFQKKQKGAYLAALRKGFLDEICSHMSNKPFVPTGGNKGKPAKNRKDLTGKKFGRWTVLNIAGKYRKQLTWNVVCEKGHTAEVTGGNLRSGLSTGCVECSKQISAPTKELHAYITSLGINAILSDKSTGKELDILIPDHKFVIEYDGLLWHSTKFRTTIASERARFRHINANNLTCFRIFEDEWERSPELIKAMIKSRLGAANGIVPKCLTYKVIENPKLYRQFFEKNHIDGYAGANWAVGAFDADVLVSCMTFRKYTKGIHKGQIELARFCSDYEYNAYGCFSKLLKLAKTRAKNLGFSTIVSASDNRLSQGKIYYNNGFKEVPNSDYVLNYYYYMHSKGRRIHRFQCRKLKVPEISLEESLQYNTEALQCSNGLMASKKFGKWEPLYKVYGWGNKLWVLRL